MINISERNRKIAINRWKKVLLKSSEQFRENSIKYPHLKARVIGYLMGDGYISIHKEINGTVHYSIGFYPDDESMLQSFVESFTTIYNLSPNIRNLGKYYSLRINSRPVALDLLSMADFNSLDWTIPPFVSMEEKIEFLRAIYDCEGYVGKKVIAIQSVNEKGLRGVQSLLKEFAIESNFYSYKRKNLNWNTNYLLYITKTNSRRNFLKHIGFYHGRKQAKLLAGVA